MTLEEEDYWGLDKMIPQSVSRDLALTALRAGEPESAITMLLCEAFTGIGVPDNIVQFLRERYDGGFVIEVLDDLLLRSR